MESNSSALPTELHPYNLVDLTGIEPMSRGFQSRANTYSATDPKFLFIFLRAGNDKLGPVNQ